jgi:hypothetical protein
VLWQEGYFDHRLRPDERGTQFSAKLNYIRRNPLAARLCARAEDWPWIIDPFGSKGGSACPQEMPVNSPKAQMTGGKAACVSQRVEDNAFHLGTSGDKSRRLLTARLDGGNFGEIGREFVGWERLNIHFD